MRVITDLVNSSPAPGRAEGLATLSDLQERLTDWLVTEIVPSGPEDLAALHQVRERLRAVVVAPGDDERIAIVNDLLARTRIRPRIVAHDNVGSHLHWFAPYCPVAEHLQVECAMTLALLLVDGEGARLRTCAATDCSNAFYDTSKNKSKIYCDKAGCGNRIHAAAYRARAAARSGASRSRTAPSA